MKPNFVKIVRRQWPTLLINMISQGMGNKEYFKTSSLDFCFQNFKYLDSDCYYDMNEILELSRIIKKKAREDKDFISRLAKICYYRGQKLFSLSERIKKINYQDKNILAAFEKFQEVFGAFMPFIMIPISVERILEEKSRGILKKKLKDVGKEKFFDDYFIILTTPKKKNITGEEMEAMEKLTMIVLKSKTLKELFNKSVSTILKEINSFPKFKKELNKYLAKFAWIGKRNFVGQAWEEKDVIKRIKNLTKSKKRFQKKIDLVSHNIKLSEKIIRELNFSKKEKELVNLVKEFVFLRTHRMDVLNIAFYNITNLIEEIAKRFGYNYEDIIYMNIKEVASLEKQKPSKFLLSERRRKYFYITLNGKCQFFIEKNFKKELVEKEKVELVQEVKGVIANKGMATGEVKLIMNKRQLNKVKENDILVTSMTTPDFISAMERASAFVTDEGGILCHAAIVSREMNKPCIIGTKIATKVLKDGDLVEVDANKGIIKVLKKAKN